MGKKGRKKDFSTKEKELLEIENLKFEADSDYGNSEMVRFD